MLDVIMMAVKQDPRLILVVICAVALAYWLIIPRRHSTNKVGEVNGVKMHGSGHNQGGEGRPKEDGHGDHEGMGLGHLDHMMGGKSTEEEENQKMAAYGEEVARLRKDFENAQSQIEQLKDEVIAKEALLKESSEMQKSTDAGKGAQKEPVAGKTMILGHRIVHFDLKGAPPRLTSLKKILPFIKEQGATGILMEYEDTFPYDGDLAVLRSKDAYTKADIKELLAIAKELNMFVMPLIQTFGHLEFALKHEKFAKLRETEKITNFLCPLKNESRVLVKNMITQVLTLHNDAKWIHLGGDEVWNLKSCKRCKESSMTEADLYLHHMIPIFKFVHESSDGKTIPIIWDDMMRKWKVDDLKSIAQFVEPMIWGYVPDLEHYYKFPDGMWGRYYAAFSKVWIASAFKGADKPISNYPPISHHINNHLSWMKIVSKFPKTMEVVGITLTGWSRFDHYASLCELLPAAIPSLTFCLAVIREGHFSSELHMAVTRLLGFKKPWPTSVTNFKALEVDAGKFPGNDVFELILTYEKAKGWFDSGKVRENGWMGPHQIKTQFLSFYQIETIARTADVSIDMLKKLEPQAKKVLTRYFSAQIVDEWINDKIRRLSQEAERMKERALKLIAEHQS